MNINWFLINSVINDSGDTFDKLKIYISQEDSIEYFELIEISTLKINERINRINAYLCNINSSD